MDRVTRNTINKSQRKISSGNKLTSSATPTVTELETDVGALAGKVNLIIRALKEQNIIR